MNLSRSWALNSIASTVIIHTRIQSTIVFLIEHGARVNHSLMRLSERRRNEIMSTRFPCCNGLRACVITYPMHKNIYMNYREQLPESIFGKPGQYIANYRKERRYEDINMMPYTMRGMSKQPREWSWFFLCYWPQPCS